jgi:hypothetical protein
MRRTMPGFAEGAVKPMTSDEQVAKYIERARRHVELGRLLIERHKEMVERHRVEGRDTTPAENLLAALERTQQVFERDLARLEVKR